MTGGFSQADPPLGPGWDSTERGRIWFAASKAIARQTCCREGCWVMIEVPDSMPEYAFDDGTPFVGNFHLDIDQVNALPMEFEVGD